MPWPIRVVAGALLVAHGLVHLLYVSHEAESANYAFTLKQSWLVPEGARQTTGVVLMAATVAAFALLGLGVWGVPLLARLWSVLTVVAAGLSLALLVAFFDAELVFGVTIDVVLIVLAVWQPEWTAQIHA